MLRYLPRYYVHTQVAPIDVQQYIHSLSTWYRLPLTHYYIDPIYLHTYLPSCIGTCIQLATQTALACLLPKYAYLALSRAFGNLTDPAPKAPSCLLG